MVIHADSTRATFRPKRGEKVRPTLKFTAPKQDFILGLRGKSHQECPSVLLFRRVALALMCLRQLSLPDGSVEYFLKLRNRYTSGQVRRRIPRGGLELGSDLHF